MEHVPGENLKQHIRCRGRLCAAEAVAVARQIAEALVQAHAAGVIHRDIKPQNIILTDRGTVKVTDFGIAHAVDGTTVTNGSTIFGSVHYFPPEQARGNAVGEQSDLYSLGIVLYEMVTGQVPFSGDTPLSVAMKHLQQAITPPGSWQGRCRSRWSGSSSRRCARTRTSATAARWSSWRISFSFRIPDSRGP